MNTEINLPVGKQVQYDKGILKNSNRLKRSDVESDLFNEVLFYSKITRMKSLVVPLGPVTSTVIRITVPLTSPVV